MSTKPKIEDALREAILARPDVILDDKDVMRALMAANEKIMGANIVDLRGIAMDRLESRLDRLEDTHRSVIAAAYENLAGTNQIHRAVLRLLDPLDFNEFLKILGADVAEILRVDAVRLVLETDQDADDPQMASAGDALVVRPASTIDAYLTQGRGGAARAITLRQLDQGQPDIYGEMATYIRSEACLKLDFGAGRLPGLLVLGAEDPHMFGPQQGADLMTFFAGAFQRIMRRWLA